jgi:glucose/arabinose dehydrogenase
MIRRAALEALEPRRLLAGYPLVVQALPVLLDFSTDRGRLVDKDGEGTGFTWVQPNAAGNEYQPSLINLDIARGLLKVSSYGNARSGSNFGSDNSLVNGLQLQFDATRSGGFTITTRLAGPLDQLSTPIAQGGLMFGPDADNYVKLVAAATPGGQVLQFVDEQGGSMHELGEAGVTRNIGSFGAIQTLDLLLSGDAASGIVRAFYRIDGGVLTQVSTALTLTGASKSAFFASIARAGIIVAHKNDLQAPTVNFDSFSIMEGLPAVSQPKVTATRPGDGAINVARDFFVAADVKLTTPGAGIEESSLNSNTVKLIRARDGKVVNAVLNTAGGGDAIVLQPTSLLDPNTQYTFIVTSGLQDLVGASFQSFSSSFTTGTRGGATDPSVAFERVLLPTAQHQQFSGITIGPDHRVYATTLDGRIFRFAINSDGTLGDPDDITTVRDNNGGPRFITSIVFDPSATAGNLVAYVTHGEYAFESATDWTGMISRLSGPNLESYQDYVVGLPRSIRDHLTNQAVFGPDGKLYFAQGSQTAMGSPDNAWGLRHEHMLNASILVADTQSIAARLAAGLGPVNVKTEDGGTYDPFAPGAPVGIYATGLRSTYDLLWHSNGSLYAPTNGSAAGGNTPGAMQPFFSGTRIDQASNGPYAGPVVPPESSVSTQPDFLFKVEQGGYYGHPNPSRGEYVLNGGNPTAAVDPNEVTEYPVGTMPDRNYQGSVYEFGKNYSPDGAIEYHGDAFGGALDHSILLARYSGGDDIVALTPAADGSIPNPDTNLKSGITGLTHFVDPLDLTEDPATGNLYVVEYGAQRVTLAKPLATSGATIKTNSSKRIFSDPRGGAASLSKRVTITNIGTSALAIPSDGLQILGPDAGQFDITNSPVLPLTIAPSKSINISVVFNPPSSTSAGIKTATLRIKSNDPNTPIKNVRLRGLATTGEGGSNEPSLQRILDLYEIRDNVGDNNPADTAFPVPPRTPNDEIQAPRLIKAGDGPVTIEPLAVYGVSANPTVQFGYYEPGEPDIRTMLFNVSPSDSQTVSPTFNGATTFDPGADVQFSLMSVWPSLHNSDGSTREVYAEDSLNTWESNSSNRRKLRFYPLKESDGSVVPNAYVFAFEEFNAGYDQNDLVGIIRNVKPVKLGGELSFRNLDGAPFADRLIFNRIQHPNASIGNFVHDTTKLRLANTGTKPVTISSITLSNNTVWKLPNRPSLPLVLLPGKSFDLQIKFVATNGGYQGARLTIKSDDGDEATKVVRLQGYWQSDSEANSQGVSQEPKIETIGEALGYTTAFTYSGQSTNTGGRVQAVGDEVLSPYWSRADTSMPVNVKQLASFHQQGIPAKITWFNQGSTTLNTIFTALGSDGQTFFPRTSTSGTLAQGNFNPTSVFGFKIDTESSDDTKNKQEKTGGGYGHHVRFYPVRDREGDYVPNQWLALVDYNSINFDFQDNVYLISNIRPSSKLPAPLGAAAVSTGDGLNIAWSQVPGAVSYNLYRSDKGLGKFKRVNASPVTDNFFSDGGLGAGEDFFYRIVAVSSKGVESLPVNADGVV